MVRQQQQRRPRQPRRQRRDYHSMDRKHWRRLLGLATVLIAGMLNPSAEQPYYSSISFGVFFTPLTVFYTGLAHFWVFVIQGRKNIVVPLPTPSGANKNKLAIVTGSNTGIGFETARTLVVDYGWEVVLACRTKDKALQAMQRINEEAKEGKAVVLDIPLDLTDFDSIEQFSNNVNDHYGERQIDVLVNNAGRNSSGQSGKFDLMFRANFLGHFVLTQQLLPKLRGGRIVNLSSVMHHFVGAKKKDASFWKSMILYQSPFPPETYAASKLAAIVFTNELNRRYGESHQIRSMAVNPGACSSDIWRDFPAAVTRVMNAIYLTPKEGSAPSVAAAVKDDWADHITYLQPLWLPSQSEATAFPLCEMIAPYIGYAASAPRLPQNEDNNAIGKALWETCEELSGYQYQF